MFAGIGEAKVLICFQKNWVDILGGVTKLFGSLQQEHFWKNQNLDTIDNMLVTKVGFNIIAAVFGLEGTDGPYWWNSISGNFLQTQKIML